MTEAIFGLVGVLVGVLVTAGIQAAASWRGEQRALRVAARVVQVELSFLMAHLRTAIEARSVDPLGYPRHLVEVWAEHRNALAHVDADVWAVVVMAVRDETWLPALEGHVWDDGLLYALRKQVEISSDASQLLMLIAALPLHPGRKRRAGISALNEGAADMRGRLEAGFVEAYAERFPPEAEPTVPEGPRCI